MAASGDVGIVSRRDGPQLERSGSMVTRGDIGMVLGLAGFLLGGSAFYFGFRTSARVVDIDGVMQADGALIEQFAEDKTQLQSDVQAANKRISLSAENIAALEAREMRDVLRLAVALAALGGREGIDVLVDVVLRDAGSAQETVDARWRAGLKLNELLAREFVRGGPDLDAKLRAKALTDAGDQLRTWWAAAKDRVRFDEASRTWKD